MMWHVEGFNARENPADVAAFLQDHLLPFFRERGFTVRAFATQAALGPRAFWLATEIVGFSDIDGWAAHAGDEGAELISGLLSMVEAVQAGVVQEL